MSEHTPGPWKAVCGVDDDDTRWIVVAAGAEHEYHIATVENGQPGDSLETEAATARLIAAAPDLLAKLREIHAGMACSCRLEPFVGGPVPCVTCQIGALVAKSEGRS